MSSEEIQNVADRGEKWEAVTDRLKKREEDRLDKLRKSKEQSVENRAENERAQHFLSEFERRRQSLITSLQSDAVDNGTTASTVMDDAQRLEVAASELRVLSTMATEAQMFLSSYDRKSVNEALVGLQEQLTAKQKCLVPRSRFAFKNRRKKVEEVSQAPVKMAVLVDEPDRREEKIVEWGFTDRVSEKLILAQVESDGRDVELRRLSGCRVTVMGNPGTVHVTACVDCLILLGPVSTSVFVDNCSGSTFQLACQQLRVHRSIDCRFWVDVSSRSIVEDCRRLGFGPLNSAYYEQMAIHFERSGLIRRVDDGGATNNWDRVDDFDWLVAGTPSPNWSKLSGESDVDLKP